MIVLGTFGGNALGWTTRMSRRPAHNPRTQALLDGFIVPVAKWMNSHLPRWAVMLLGVPFAVVAGPVIAIIAVEPMAVRIRTEDGRVIDIFWPLYRRWPAGLDAWETELTKIRDGGASAL